MPRVNNLCDILCVMMWKDVSGTLINNEPENIHKSELLVFMIFLVCSK